MGTVSFPENMVSAYKSTRPYYPEDRTRRFHSRQNLKFETSQVNTHSEEFRHTETTTKQPSASAKGAEFIKKKKLRIPHRLESRKMP
jgi:hypothetical protein